MIRRTLLLFLFPLLSFVRTGSPAGLAVELKLGASGNSYTIIYKNETRMSFTLSRPDKNDSSILLCIPAAFTRLDNFAVDGLYICDGKSGNEKQVNHSLGGAIRIVKGECSIFPTAKGKWLTDSLVKSIAVQHGSLFQQIQMIENGVPAKFKDKQYFQRRGIAVFKNGKTAVVESKNATTLKIFAEDLCALGVKDLLYTDMGSWDEGWFRDATGKLVIMGNNRSQTAKQSNWVTFHR